MPIHDHASILSRSITQWYHHTSSARVEVQSQLRPISTILYYTSRKTIQTHNQIPYFRIQRLVIERLACNNRIWLILKYSIFMLSFDFHHSLHNWYISSHSVHTRPFTRWRKQAYSLDGALQKAIDGPHNVIRKGNYTIQHHPSV